MQVLTDRKENLEASAEYTARIHQNSKILSRIIAGWPRFSVTRSVARRIGKGALLGRLSERFTGGTLVAPVERDSNAIPRGSCVVI